MLEIDNRTKVLVEFFRINPSSKSGLQLREIARRVGFAPTSVKNYLDDLEEEEVVIRKKQPESNYPIYYPNFENEYFKFIRSLHFLKGLRETGLINHLESMCRPQVIVVSGLGLHGENPEISMIKIIMDGQQKELNLQTYEGVLGFKIVPVFLVSFNELSQELGEEIMNGIVIKGQVRLERPKPAPVKTLTEKEYLKMIEEEHKRVREEVLPIAENQKREQEEDGFYSRVLSDI